jgi:hypothetical protein
VPASIVLLIPRLVKTCALQEALIAEHLSVKNTKPQNPIARIKLHKMNILRFMKDCRIPFTNNPAERDARMVKVQQKISGTFRSSEGASNFCRTRGYISTVKKNGVPVLVSIRGAFVGNLIPSAEIERPA